MSSQAPVLSPQELTDAARRFGTPLYVYHAERIAWQYGRLTRAFSGCDARFFYACKSLTNLNILRYVHRLGANLDCVSLNEVRLGLMAGFPPERILFTPNCTDFEEYAAAVELGVRINIDSLPILDRFGERYADGWPVCIRLNPHILAGGNLKISTGHAHSKFGISVEQIDEVREVVRSRRLRVEGIHMHTGSDIKEVGVFLEGLELMLRMSAHFPELGFIDLGSGFKVPYRPGDPETDIELLGLRVSEAFERHAVSTGRRLQAWFEPGKFLVSECGYLVVKANIVKRTPADVFVGVDSGFNHLIRPMFYEAHHEIANITHPDGEPHPYTVVGNICETDTFATGRMLPEVREGDLLVFRNAGAYGFEMSSRFNSRFRPAEVLYLDGEARLIRRREEFDDLLHGQLEVL
ncbi:MAG: diaminopimelate decarboxylase [Chitinophagia bacterium]|nr:diaminopimelate decarboxylase [Chitinophagia bacterium]